MATVNGMPVGIAHVSLDKPEEVWLRAARTDPNYRRIGVATAITEKCLKFAKQKGAKVAQLATQSNNVAVQAVLEKIGFKPVAEFVEMKNEKLADEQSEGSRWVEQNEAEAVWSYLQGSKCYRKSAGLYTIMFHYFSLDKQDLKRFIAEHKAIVHERRRSKVDGLILIDDSTAKQWRERSLQTCYLDGNQDAVADMMKFVENYSKATKVRKIYGFTVNIESLRAALEKLGFEPPEWVDIVYEKKL